MVAYEDNRAKTHLHHVRALTRIRIILSLTSIATKVFAIFFQLYDTLGHQVLAILHKNIQLPIITETIGLMYK